MFFNAKFAVYFTYHLYVLCGVYIEGAGSEMKIFNGSSAVGHRYLKHVVKVYYVGAYCAGAIITSNAILTAAHCITDEKNKPRLKNYDESEAFICAGNSRFDCESPTAQIRGIRNIFLPKEYIAGHTENDIAILILSKALVEDENTVERVKLPDRATPAGTDCTLIGWGDLLCKQNYQLPSEAQYTTLTITSETYCEGNFPAPVPKTNLCAIDKSNNSIPCGGDSGSPLICNGRVVGVESMGMRITGYPEVYMDIIQYRDWINDVIKAEDQNLRSNGARVRLRTEFLCLIFLSFLVESVRYP